MASPKSVVNIRKQFRKTKMCSYHLAGRCTFGASCFYAHSQEDIQDAPNLSKTKLCIQWQQGQCQLGSKCKFAHGAKELRSTNAVYKTVLCQYWPKGHCSLGNACRYAHGTVEHRQVKEAEPKPKKKKARGDAPAVEPFAPAPRAAPPPMPALPNGLPSGFPGTLTGPAVPAFPAGFAMPPMPGFPGMPNPAAGNLDPQQTEILRSIVSLCSQLQDMGGNTTTSGAAPEPETPMSGASAKTAGLGFTTPSTIASSTTSPSLRPQD